jgi:hypothetical protein
MGIRRFRLLEQLEALPNELRPHRQTVVRFVYLTSIMLLALWLADTFLGGFGRDTSRRISRRLCSDRATSAAPDCLQPRTIATAIVHQSIGKISTLALGRALRTAFQPCVIG